MKMAPVPCATPKCRTAENLTQRLTVFTVFTVFASVVLFARTAVLVNLVKRSAGSAVLAGKTCTRTLAKKEINMDQFRLNAN